MKEELEHIKAITPIGRRHLRLAKWCLEDFAPYSRRGRLIRAIWHCFISFFTRQF